MGDTKETTKKDTSIIHHSNNRLNRLITGPRNFSEECTDSKGNTITSGAQVETNAKFWLRRMNEMKGNCDLSDKEMLFVAGDKLTNNAERWWDMCYDDITTWQEFEVAFKAQFMDEDIEKYGNELDALKQKKGEAVQQISTQFKALLHLVGDKYNPDREQVRCYLYTISSEIARDIVKRDGKPTTLANAISSAKQVESANLEFTDPKNVPYSKKEREVETSSSSSSTAPPEVTASTIPDHLDILHTLTHTLIVLA
ncbi:hypothetical protein MBANPS3_012472, partial [Mucor bainieri]